MGIFYSGQLGALSGLIRRSNAAQDGLQYLICCLAVRLRIKPENRLTLALSAVQNSHQTCEANAEVFCSQILCPEGSRKTWSRRSCMIFNAEGNLGRATKWRSDQ